MIRIELSGWTIVSAAVVVDSPKSHTCSGQFSKDEVKMMEKFETKGYRIVAKDERQHLLTLERETDEIKC